MIGVVIVSHSAKLAEGVVELVMQVAQDKVRVAPAGGTSDGGIGTDAFRVLEAIQTVDSEEGVLVLMDLGSAVLSAETAVDFLDEAQRGRVRLCSGPLVEGAVAAVSLAAAGGTLEEIAAEAEGALSGKATPTVVLAGAIEERTVTLPNRLGLHARPAARIIRLARRYGARMTIENLTAHIGPVDAGSLNAMLSLRGRQGHELRFRAEGSQARQAIAEMAAFVESGCGDVEEAPHPTEDAGIGASAGIAIGPLVRIRTTLPDISRQTCGDPDAEWQRLQVALSGAQRETRALYDWARQHAGENQAGIFDAQSLLLEDPELIELARSGIFDERRDAASAWQSAASSFAEQFGAIDREADLTDVSARVLEKVSGAGGVEISLHQPAILAAHDLLPSHIEKLDPALVLGLCLETGSASAHTAILARARGIPAVVGLGPALSTVAEGTTVAIDGEQGKLWVSPGEDEIRHLEELRCNWLAARQASQAIRHHPATTRDGRRITVLANLSREAQVFDAIEYGAEGVGVLRTEFLFLDRKTPPDEEEQFSCYRNIAEALDERTLVIRTLDIGGDKSVPYIDIGAEANPFLGWRGIRIMLERRDLFKTQLRAIMRAADKYPVEVLLPMISTLQELREAKAFMGELGLRIPVGAMIEVPAAALLADRLAPEVSRLSIGTNDLVQYLMAADRTNARVAHTADHFQPAVLRAIRDTVIAGRNAGINVDVCGEMAPDPLAAPLLLGLGVEEFSVSPPMIPDLKRAIARWTVVEAEDLARQALEAESAAAVRSLCIHASSNK
jgi:phosphocarrier protein FPr